MNENVYEKNASKKKKFFDENVKILSAWAMRETKNEVILACVCSFSSLICIRRNLNNFPINIYTLLNTDTRIAHTIVLCACLSILTCHGSLHICSQFYLCLHFGKHYYWRWLWWRFVRYAYLHVWRILKFSHSISLLFIHHLMCAHCLYSHKQSV